jgi:hypothetical protein
VRDLLLGVGLVVAVGAAGRSTWSPCGLSMLSTITPFGERSRGHRYPATAAWFVLGATLGGVTLGAATAVLAEGASAGRLGGHPGPVAVIAALAALAAAGIDAGAFGEVLPVIRRQVDDGWLGRYRPWVYAGGFGWQVGVGVATYLMTAAVGLLVVLGALTASPARALLICTTFGLARGLTVFLTSTAPDPFRLRALHARLDRFGPPVRRAVIGLQIAAAAALMAAVWLPAGLIVLGAAGAGAVLMGARPRMTRRRAA